MKKIHAESNSSTTKRIRPALTPEARQNQLISLAIDLVEKRLIEELLLLKKLRIF